MSDRRYMSARGTGGGVEHPGQHTWSRSTRAYACISAVHQLTSTTAMSTHHREYGFPSSHSTNAISIALLVGQWFWEGRDVIGYTAVACGWVALFAYYAIIAFGRLYTGMHSTCE